MDDLLNRLRVALADRYRVDGLIGEGGMALVYRAHDLKHDRPVAIKLLRPELGQVIGEDRFNREIRFEARLQHPNIVPLYDSGSADGQLFYVMPLIEGESLRQRLEREKQLPIEDVLRLGTEVADALAYAHEHGVVHRDIKPENIMLVGAHALVADFGIAKALTAAGGDKLTQAGMAIGTPAYMSPEQAVPDSVVDPRSDQYSLACVIYETLAGAPPFAGPTPMALMARHSMERVPSLRIVRQTIPEALEAVIFRALEKVPADRFGSMSQFTAALQAAAHGPTGSMPVATPSRSARARRWRVAVAGLALVGAVSLAWSWASRRSTPAAAAGDADARQIAVLYFETPTDQDSLRYLADALTEGLIDQLRQVPGLAVISKGGSRSYRGSALSPDSIGRALGVGTLVEGSVERRGTGLHLTVRLVEAASNAEFRRKGFVLAGGDAQPVLDSATAAVAEFLRARLGEEVRLRKRQAATASSAAWAYLQRALVVAHQADSLAKFARAGGETDGLPAAAAEQFDVADSLLRLARAADPAWVDPVVQLATMAYSRSRNVNANPIRAEPWITRSLALADTAVRLDPANAEAREVRGTAQYWGYLLGLYAAEQEERLLGAKRDLDQAVAIEPDRASAWASLSHLHYQMGGLTDALLAARRAYEADAYLANAEKVLYRLFIGSYDNGNQVDATHWCTEGGRRFPSMFDFVECKLLVMTMPDATPDIALAWRLRDSALAVAPVPDRPFQQEAVKIWLAAILARAGLADSARQVLQGVTYNPRVDPQGDLYLRAAFASTLLGDRDAAYTALRQRLAVNSGGAVDLRTGWWFTPLVADPRFTDLSAPVR